MRSIYDEWEITMDKMDIDDMTIAQIIAELKELDKQYTYLRDRDADKAYIVRCRIEEFMAAIGWSESAKGGK